MTDVPIPCKLSAAALPLRLAAWHALAADGLLDCSPTPTGLRVRLRDSPDIVVRARALVAAESECCPFLDLRLARLDGGLVLEIGGPAAARPLIARIFR